MAAAGGGWPRAMERAGAVAQAVVEREEERVRAGAGRRGGVERAREAGGVDWGGAAREAGGEEAVREARGAGRSWSCTRQRN